MVAFTDKIAVGCQCPFCGSESVVVVERKDYTNWQNGELVQNAFPYLDADARELLITGICPKCWEDTFGESAQEEGDILPMPDYY